MPSGTFAENATIEARLAYLSGVQNLLVLYFGFRNNVPMVCSDMGRQKRQP